MNIILEKINLIKEDFKNLNPKEYYSWPLSIQILIGVFALILVFIIGIIVDINPLNSELNNHQKKEETLKKEFIEKKRQAVNLDLYKEQLEVVTKDSDNLLKQLPDKSQMEKLLIDINQAAILRGLSVELFKPNQEKIKDFYAELPIDIKLIGTFEAVGKFTADLSQLSRVVIFNTMEINLDKNNQVSLTAQIKTFRYLDQDELDEQARKQAEEKKKLKKGKAKSTKEDKNNKKEAKE